MKKRWITLLPITLILTGCATISSDPPPVAVTTPTTTPNSIEIKLRKIELEAGFGNRQNAANLISELINYSSSKNLTENQQGRLNTMKTLLSTYLDNDEEILVINEVTLADNEFSGSVAASKVFNMMGFLPEGYVLVYHEIPSAFGSTGLGYYVFLLPANYDELEKPEARETFFVTNYGEILVFE